MTLVSQGLSNKEIGNTLHLTEGTIKIHLHNIYEKLGIRNRTELTAVAIAHRHELISRLGTRYPLQVSGLVPDLSMTDFVDTSRPQTAKDHTRRNKAIQQGGRGSEANIGHVPTAGLFLPPQSLRPHYSWPILNRELISIRVAIKVLPNLVRSSAASRSSRTACSISLAIALIPCSPNNPAMPFRVCASRPNSVGSRKSCSSLLAACSES